MKRSKTLFLFISLFLLIFFRFLVTRPTYKNGQKVRITAQVLNDPIKYSTYQYLRLAGLKVYLPINPEVSYGDKIIVEGVVSDDKLDHPKLIEILNDKTFLSGFRNGIINFYVNSLPQPEAGLLGGVVIGAKGALRQDFYNQTKNTGVAHVVVASGTNVTFVVSFLMSVFLLILPRRRAIYFGILGIILYLFVSGFDAPLIRAAIMTIVAFGAQETGRLINSWRLLLISAGMMLIYNPDWVFDIGFILSFVATMSLIFFEGKVRKYLSFVPEILKEGLSTSIAAQIGVAPVLFVTFGQFNILSPIINALVLWTVPYMMILGALGGVFKLKFILYLCYPFLWWFTTVVKFFS